MRKLADVIIQAVFKSGEKGFRTACERGKELSEFWAGNKRALHGDREVTHYLLETHNGFKLKYKPFQRVDRTEFWRINGKPIDRFREIVTHDFMHRATLELYAVKAGLIDRAKLLYAPIDPDVWREIAYEQGISMDDRLKINIGDKTVFSLTKKGGSYNSACERNMDELAKNQHKFRLKKQGRNELCQCGSGYKYKKCCLGVA